MWITSCLNHQTAIDRWDMEQRSDPTGLTPLLVWTRGTESGMDNSQRFDDGQPDHLLAVDFSVFMARETMLLSKIGSALGEHSAASDWAKISTNISAAIHSVMWDDTTQLYHDVHAGTNGAKSPVKAVTGFLPIWLPDIPLERLDMLMATMNDPKVHARTCEPACKCRHWVLQTFKTALPSLVPVVHESENCY